MFVIKKFDDFIKHELPSIFPTAAPTLRRSYRSMPSWVLETENLEISFRAQYQLVGSARSRRDRREGGGSRRGREERPRTSVESLGTQGATVAAAR